MINFKSVLLADKIRFLVLSAVTVVITYFASSIAATLWYIFLLIWYFYSEDEPFWLVFFLITSDGFMGFFGLYEVSIRLLPGLPAIELVQFYILLSGIKALRKNVNPDLFYNNYITVLLIYTIFLIVWGQMLGYSGALNEYFRILKDILPLLLFYSIPRLLRDMFSYQRLFSLIFLVLLLAFFTQIFTLITGIFPLGTDTLTKVSGQDKGEFRSFYNTAATLLGIFGALFFLSSNNKSIFNPNYLYIIVFSAFGMAFLSATRGWILGFGLIIILSFIFVLRGKTKRVIIFFFISLIIILMGLSNPRIQEQVNFSIERTLKLEALTEGDLTAQGSLKRLSEKGPKVMKIWRENPVFGWGYSDVARANGDGHVGNQNLLMTSGALGYLLLNVFFVFFMYKMLTVYPRKRLNPGADMTPLVFVIFLTGWLFIHSTSGQHFSYGGMPVRIIPQAVFFSFGAFIYSQIKKARYTYAISKKPVVVG